VVKVAVDGSCCTSTPAFPWYGCPLHYTKLAFGAILIE
jgi:hypothetical protein